jgi:hypothetical protein
MKLLEILIKEDFRSKFKEFTSDGINPETVKYYLNTFRKIKEKNPTAFKYTKDLYALESIPLEKRNDIDQYKTFYALESVVDFSNFFFEVGLMVVKCIRTAWLK